MLELFITFFKVGALSYGGGYAMISLLQEEALSRGWMTLKEFTDMVAISQITPGPIAVNMATFVGFKELGVLGSFATTLGVSLPSLIIVLVAVNFIKRFNNSALMKNVFFGLRPAVMGLILAAAVQIAWPEFFPSAELMAFSQIPSVIELCSILISTAVGIAILKFKQSPIVAILASAAVGLIVFS